MLVSSFVGNISTGPNPRAASSRFSLTVSLVQSISSVLKRVCRPCLSVRLQECRNDISHARRLAHARLRFLTMRTSSVSLSIYLPICLPRLLPFMAGPLRLRVKYERQSSFCDNAPLRNDSVFRLGLRSSSAVSATFPQRDGREGKGRDRSSLFAFLRFFSVPSPPFPPSVCFWCRASSCGCGFGLAICDYSTVVSALLTCFLFHVTRWHVGSHALAPFVFGKCDTSIWEPHAHLSLLLHGARLLWPN